MNKQDVRTRRNTGLIEGCDAVCLSFVDIVLYACIYVHRFAYALTHTRMNMGVRVSLHVSIFPTSVTDPSFCIKLAIIKTKFFVRVLGSLPHCNRFIIDSFLHFYTHRSINTETHAQYIHATVFFVIALFYC